MNISVGDFAEQLLNQEEARKESPVRAPSIAPDPSVYSPNVLEQAPDISEVHVPANFVQDICENKKEISVPPALEETVVSDEEDLRTLMEDIKTLLVQVREALSEMTTVGAIGVNVLEKPPALSAKDKKKQRKINDPERDEDDRVTKLLRQVRNKRVSQ